MKHDNVALKSVPLEPKWLDSNPDSTTYYLGQLTYLYVYFFTNTMGIRKSTSSKGYCDG